MAKSNLGSILKIGEGRYRVRVQRGVGPDGRPCIVDKTFSCTREEAQLKAAAIALSMNRAGPLPSTMSLRQYWESVFPLKPSVRGTSRSSATMAFYRSQMERNVLPVIGSVALCTLTHDQVARVIYGASSPVNTKRTLSAVLRSAYDDGLLSEKPFDRRVPVHREKKPQETPWTRFEASAALDALADGDPRLLAYLVLGLSGLRKEEALGARPCDIRMEDTYSFATGDRVETMTVTVAQTYTQEGGVVPRAKNPQSLRCVPVLVPGREPLRKILDEGRCAAEDVAVWSQSRIVDMSGSRLNKLWKRELERAGLRVIPPSMLRHTSDTLMLSAGVDGDLNDKYHGRSSHSSTYENYLRPDLGVLETAAQAVGGIVGANLSGTV